MLRQLAAMTQDFTPPKGTCNPWRALYRNLQQLQDDLMQHIHLENNILFVAGWDGCHLRCCEHCLHQAGVSADQHFLLADYGVKKQYHADFAEAYRGECRGGNDAEDKRSSGSLMA